MLIKVRNTKAEVEVEKDIPLPELIRLLNKAWGKSPYDINNGDCDSFADALYAAAEQMGLYVEWFDSYDEVGLPVHYWVCIEGKHYDAEAPEEATSRDTAGDLTWRRASKLVDSSRADAGCRR